MDILGEIKKLNLPTGQYIIVGSGIMSIKGIRPTSDLDIVTTLQLFEEYKKQQGWQLFQWTKPGVEGREWLRRGEIEIYQQVSHKDGILFVADLLENAEIIDGIPFNSLSRLIEFKKEYGRPKDLHDIQLIQEYLSKKDQKR